MLLWNSMFKSSAWLCVPVLAKIAFKCALIVLVRTPNSLAIAGVGIPPASSIATLASANVSPKALRIGDDSDQGDLRLGAETKTATDRLRVVAQKLS